MVVILITKMEVQARVPVLTSRVIQVQEARSNRSTQLKTTTMRIMVVPPS